jgi:glycosyltransferase involved in cell wall biosynthesis
MMNYISKVSVIIPTYNRAQSIGRSVDSVLKQSYQDFEIIVVDDGSTDNTRDILFSFGNHIKCIRQDNKGPSTARNVGINASKGEYVAFLDSDDYFMKSNLETKISFLQSNPQIGWVYSDWAYVDDEDNDIEKGSSKFRYSEKKLNGNIFEELLKSRNFISPCTVVVRKSILEDIGHFDPLIPSQEEYDLWLRISLKYPVYYVDKVLVAVTLHPASLSKNSTKWAQGNSIIADKLKDLIPHDFQGRQRLLNKIIADKHTFLGRDFFQRGQFRKAIHEYWNSIKHLPSQKRVYWLMLAAIIRLITGYLYPALTPENDRS